jgi:hypothetical protein
MSTIILNNSTRLSDLQDWFFATFEFLKIEFYKNGHQEFEGNQKDELLNSAIELNKLGFNKSEYPFEINETLKVQQVEDKFKNELNLNVQIFRKSGDVWLQTTSTDEWTLLEQIERAAYHEQE